MKVWVSADYEGRRKTGRFGGGVEICVFKGKNNEVVVSNMFYFHPYLGKIPILTHIFQMG